MPGEVPPNEELLRGGQLLDEISSLMKTVGIAVDDLAAHDILPVTLTNRLLTRTLRDIAVALANPANRDARERALNGCLAFEQAFQAQGGLIGEVLQIAALARADSRSLEPLRSVLGRVGRHVDPASYPADIPPALIENRWLTSDPDMIAVYRDDFARWLADLRGDPSRLDVLDLRQEWNKWRDEIDQFLSSGRWPPHRTTYSDFLLAAADTPPGNIFRAQLGRMDQFDWSRAALAALDTRMWPAEAPHWLLIVSLGMLGFDGSLLRGLMNAAPPTHWPATDDDEKVARSAAERAEEADQAILYVRAASAGRRGAEIVRKQPVLSLSKGELLTYSPGLAWLAKHNAFVAAAFEEGSDIGEAIFDSDLVRLNWVQVSRKSAPNEEAALSGRVIYDVRTPADLARAVRRGTKPS